MASENGSALAHTLTFPLSLSCGSPKVGADPAVDMYDRTYGQGHRDLSTGRAAMSCFIPFNMIDQI